MQLKTRQIGKEITDDLSLSDPEVLENLKELEVINAYFGGHNNSLYGIKKLLPQEANAGLSIADFGCGGGDTLVYLNKNLPNLNNIQLIGIDGSRNIADFARARVGKSSGIKIIQGNIFSDEIKNKAFDIVHCSLVCHHFEEDKLIQLFRQLNQQTKFGFVINDLHRHFLPIAGVKLLNGSIIKTSIGKHDGVQSVRRGFLRKELKDILTKAGIREFNIIWKWPFRWLVVVKK